MNINDKSHKESMRHLCDELFAVEQDRQSGHTGYTISQVVAMMQQAIKKATAAN